MPVKMSLARGFAFNRELIFSGKHDAYQLKLAAYESKMPQLQVGDVVRAVYQYTDQVIPRADLCVVVDCNLAPLKFGRRLYAILSLAGERTLANRIGLALVSNHMSMP